MESKLAHILCKYLLKSGTIPRDLFDVYVYGIELLLSFIISVGTILLLGLLSNNLIISVTYLIVFIFTRKYVGGYHASTHLNCQICSLVVFIIVWLLTNHIQTTSFTIFVVDLIGLIIIALYAPIKNPYKPLTDRQARKCKHVGVLLFLASSLCSLLIYYSNKTLCNAVFYTQTAVIVLMIQPIIFRKEKKE